MGKTDLDTDAAAAAGRREEHRGGRITRMRSVRRGRGSGSSEAISRGMGDRRGAVVPWWCCRALPVPP